MRKILLVLLLVTGPARLAAQWRIAILDGSAAAHGDARNDTDPARPEFHADRPTTVTVSIAHDHGRARFGVESRYTTADLIEEGASVAVTTFGVFQAWGAGAELGIRVAGRADAAQLRAGAGAGLDRWQLEGGLARWRPSARGALEADFPFAQDWSAVIRAEVTVGPSIFIAEELPESFSPQASWRTGITRGIARRIGGRQRAETGRR